MSKASRAVLFTGGLNTGQASFISSFIRSGHRPWNSVLQNGKAGVALGSGWMGARAPW